MRLDFDLSFFWFIDFFNKHGSGMTQDKTKKDCFITRMSSESGVGRRGEQQERDKEQAAKQKVSRSWMVIVIVIVILILILILIAMAAKQKVSR